MHTSLMSYNQNMIPSGDDRPVFPTIDLFANTSLEELQQSLCAAVANYRDFLTRKILPFQQSWVVRVLSESGLDEETLRAIKSCVFTPCCSIPGAVQPDRIWQHDSPIYIYTSLNLLSQYVEGKTLLRCYRKFVLASSLPPYRTDIPAEELKNVLNSILPGAYSMPHAVSCFVAILPSKKFTISMSKITTRGGAEEHFVVFSREENDIIPYDIVAVGKTLFSQSDEEFGLPNLSFDELQNLIST
uniref:Cytokinin glycosidase domain-containing protein n=1 Tax=Agrobacterium tumefaciens TaxID=358 RepID=Q9WWE5_AGRTU|nr:hypothetical protein [Agrobacterium tumefaciens]